MRSDCRFSLLKLLSLVCLAGLLLTNSGCPSLNQQPDYMGQHNAQFNVADPTALEIERNRVVQLENEAR